MRQIKSNPLYYVSDDGFIYSSLGRGKWLMGSVNSCGYIQVVLRPDAKVFCVHRLVLETFLGKCPLEADHINGNKSDNSLQNLEYVTRSENMIRAHHMKRRSINGYPRPRN